MKNIVSILILILSVLISSESFSQKKAVFPQKKAEFPQKKAINNNTEYLTDQSGNTYKTVKIGSNVWIAENFKGKHYSNGDAIEQYKISSSKFTDYFDPLFCILKNDNYVYSWAAITDSRGIAPTGWHVASVAEWEELLSICKSYKDIRSVTGWPIRVEGGKIIDYATECQSCKDWNESYRDQVPCHKCKNTRVIRNKKFFPKKVISLNGTNRLNLNIEHMGWLFRDIHKMESDLYWTSEINITKKSESYILNIPIWDWYISLISAKNYWDKPKIESINTRDYSENILLPLRLVKNK